MTMFDEADKAGKPDKPEPQRAGGKLPRGKTKKAAKKKGARAK